LALAKTAYHHGDLRAALIQAALDVIDELGPKALTIREVAHRAGVSHAAPYRHFADKDALITAVVEQGFELLRTTMLERRAEAGDDPLQKFAASGFAYVDFAIQYPTYYRVMFSGDLLSSTGAESLQHTSTETFRQLVEDLEMCQQMGLVVEGDPLLQATAVWSTVHGFVSLANDNRITHLGTARPAFENARDFVLTAIFHGLVVRP